jgi:hypothetical protein
MAGLPVFYGSPVSAYADDHLDLAGLGTLLAVSRQPGLNELSCVSFTEDFGRDHVFTMNTRRDSGHEKHSVAGELGGRTLFKGERTVEDLVALFRKGASVKQAEITETYSFDEFQAQYPEAIVFMGFDASDTLRFPVADEDFSPVAGWELTAIIPGENEQPEVRDGGAA